jgi:hypothetical protein
VLGFLPRLSIRHTPAEERGQMYTPQVNWLLMLATIGLVLGFRTSSSLAAAAGSIVVAMTTWGGPGGEVTGRVGAELAVPGSANAPPTGCGSRSPESAAECGKERSMEVSRCGKSS